MKTSLLIFLNTIIISQFAFAQAAENQNELVTPVIVKTSQNETGVSAVSVDTNVSGRKNELELLRQEILSAQNQAFQKTSHKQVFVETNKRFAPETFTFFVAIGAVTYNTMWIKSSGDPLAMERHIMSLKDPISHISFYAFMQANGHYMNFHTNRLGSVQMDPLTRNQMLRRISYQGLAVGSIASQVVSTLGYKVQACTNAWIDGKTDKASLDSCNEAWSKWTIRKDFVQLFPSIISLWTSQAITEMVETAADRAFTNAVKSQAVKLTKEAVLKWATKIRAVDVVMTLNPFGGTELKAVKWIGSVARIGAFVAIDHLVSKYINRPLNNLILPTISSFDISALNRHWNILDKAQWNESKIENKHISGIEKEIENYTKDMQQWRGHLNEDVETDFAGWMEMTNKLLNQIDFAHKFYSQFLDTLAETIEVNNKVKSGELDKSALKVISNYPFRTLPFFGVKIGAYKPVQGVNLNDLYLTNPMELEKVQYQHLINLGKKYAGRSPVSGVAEQLRSGHVDTMVAGILSLKQIFVDQAESTRVRSKHQVITPKYSHSQMETARSLQNELGSDANPQIYPLGAFSAAAYEHTDIKTSAALADFNKGSISRFYLMQKATDVMMYNIFCGSAQGKLRKFKVAGADMLAPEFAPPRLFKANVPETNFCESYSDSNNFYRGKINGENLSNYLLKNIDRRLLNKANFEKWWAKNVTTIINKEFAKYDKNFREVVESFSKNYKNDRSGYKKVVDAVFNNRKKHFASNVRDNLKTETNVYLQLMNRALLNKAAVPALIKNESKLDKIGSVVNDFLWRGAIGATQEATTAYDYIAESKEFSDDKDFHSHYQKSYVEIRKLYSLMNGYHLFLNHETVDKSVYARFVKHSQKVDEMINDLLVYGGLKKVVKTDSSESAGLDFLDIDATSENTLKQYEDIKIKEKDMTLKQRVLVKSVQGLRSVESEIKRLMRMKVQLSQTLEIEQQEVNALLKNM